VICSSEMLKLVVEMAGYLYLGILNAV